MSTQLEKIRAKLGHLTMAWEPQSFLDTGYPDLNEVFGHRDKGIPYGRILEISGLESQGKTALTLTLAALAQREDAGITWIDFESSYDKEWAIKRGLETNDSLIMIQPYVGTFDKSKKGTVKRMATAQELCAEAEAALEVLHKKHSKQVLVIDSVASMLTEGEAGNGLEGNNLRSKMDLPMFLSSLLRRWVGLAQSYNVMIIFINQLRQNPMARFQDPWYTPGGNSLRYYSHVRVRVKRSGKMLLKGKPYGIQGVIRNVKNKAGGLEKMEVGYRLTFDGPIEFVPVKEVKKTTGVEEDD